MINFSLALYDFLPLFGLQRFGFNVLSQSDNILDPEASAFKVSCVYANEYRHDRRQCRLFFIYRVNGTNRPGFPEAFEPLRCCANRYFTARSDPSCIGVWLQI